MFYSRSLLIVLLLIGSLALGISACKKENNAPTLTIDTPYRGQPVSTSDSVLISGTIADDKDLHELYVTVTNAAGDTMMHKSPYVHGLVSNQYRVYFSPTDTGLYTATVTVIDHDLAYTQSEMAFNAYTAARINLLLPIDSSATPVGGSLQVLGSISDDKGLLYMVITAINARTGDTANYLPIYLNNATTYNLDELLPQANADTFNLNIAVTNHYNFITTKTVRYFVY